MTSFNEEIEELKLLILSLKKDFSRIKAENIGVDRLLTVKEVMILLKISRNSYNRLKDEGIIKVYSLRGKLYCKRNEIMQTIENCRVN